MTRLRNGALHRVLDRDPTAVQVAWRPRVSVLIPVHDAAPTVAAALGSVSAQTLVVEVLVVLNGCADDSAAASERPRVT